MPRITIVEGSKGRIRAERRHAARHRQEAGNAPEVAQDPALEKLDRLLEIAFGFGDASHDPGLRYGPVTR